MSTVKMRVNGQKYTFTIPQTQPTSFYIHVKQKTSQTILKSSKLHPPVSFGKKK